jgi:hypothetical protein
MDSVFGRSLWALYGAFVASLFNLRVTVSWPEPMRETHTNFTHIGGPAQYSVVSLNYDLILETLCVFIKQHHACEPPIDFQTEFSDRPKSSAVMLAKLHGSIDTGEIIAPTWNKSLHPNLLQKWQAGYACLANANHIRILGYSLPVSDAYIKYLLKCAAIESGHLKRIDVLCRDTTGGVQARYSEFVHSGLLRFKPCNIQDYLQAVFDASMDYKHYGHERDFNKLENVHEAFMSA